MKENKLGFFIQDRFEVFQTKSLEKSDAFVGVIYNKMRGDAQYELKKVLDLAIHLEHLLSILVAFNTDFILGKN